jgi:hypothetical protein
MGGRRRQHKGVITENEAGQVADLRLEREHRAVELVVSSFSTSGSVRSSFQTSCSFG